MNMLSVMHFWAIGIGALAVTAPVVIHFLTRPRPSVMQFSAIRLLHEVIEQRRARSRFRDWLILLLRTLAVALLAMAIARPVWQNNVAVKPEAAVDTARVIIVDTSQSMNASVAGSSSLSLARVAALEFLESLPTMEANVIFAGAKARPVFDQLSPNFPSLRESVRRVEARAERVDVRAALEAAARLLTDADFRSREVVIISDFQRAGWGSIPTELLPEGTKIQLHSVAQGDLENVAITGVRTATQPTIGKEFNLEIDVSNHSDREQKVRCRIACGSVQRTIEGTVNSQSMQTLVSKLTFDNPGWVAGWVELESNLDALSQDDRRPVAFEVRPSPKVLLLTRQPAEQKPSSSYFLEQALKVCFEGGTVGGTSDDSDVGKSSKGSTVIQRVAPQRTSAAAQPDADVIVLDHPGSLSKELTQAIASGVRRGRGLLMTTAELVDGVNLEQFAEVWGLSFQPPVKFFPDAKSSRRDLFVRQIPSRQSPFQIVGSNAALLRPVRFAGGLASQTETEGLRDQIYAELSDSSTLLYVTSVDAGQVAVLNADLGSSNWGIQPSFVPVMGEIMQSLIAGRGQTGDAYCGEPSVRLLPPSVTTETKLKLNLVDEQSAPAADPGKWEWSATQSAIVWSWPETPGPGIYRLEGNGQTAWALATAAPAIESELQFLAQDVLTDRVATGSNVAVSDSSSEESKSDDLWNWLIVACTLGLIGEIIALRWFRA